MVERFLTIVIPALAEGIQNSEDKGKGLRDIFSSTLYCPFMQSDKSLVGGSNPPAATYF